MSNIVAFPIPRITTASFVESMLRRARQLRDERLAKEQQAMPVPSGRTSADRTGAAIARNPAHPDRSRGGRRTPSPGGEP